MLKDVVKRSKILIVDDDEATVEHIQIVLRQRGFIGLQALTDPRQVLPLFSDFEPDLVLLDLHMPQLDGFSLLKQLRSRVPEGVYLPLAVLTGDMSPENKQMSLRLGAKDFIAKPIDSVDAVLRIYNLLETRFMHLEMQAQIRLLDQRVGELTQDLQLAQEQTVRHLASAAEHVDDVGSLHSQKVGIIAAALAQAVGVPDTEVRLIRAAAPLHDLGRIGIPARIRSKAAPLTEEELKILKTHAAIGGKILSGSSFPLLKLAEQIARYHHENWDGSGYLSLRADEIPLAARITAVADAFDVLVHSGPDGSALPMDEVLAEIERGRGRRFDPKLVDALLSVASNPNLLDQCQALVDNALPVVTDQCLPDRPEESHVFCEPAF